MEWTMELGQRILGQFRLEMKELTTQLTLWIPSPPIQLLLQCVNLTFALNQQDN